MIIENEDEALAEYQAQKAEAAVREQMEKQAKLDADCALYNEQRKKEQEAFNAKTRPLKVSIGIALKRLGADYEVTENGKLLIKYQGMTFDATTKLTFETAYGPSHSRFRRGAATGKIDITTGDYGDRKRFKEKASTGEHNYTNIAARLFDYMQVAKRRHEVETQQKSNATIVAELKQEFGQADWHYGALRLSSSSSPELPVFVTVEIKGAMTAEAVRALHLALKQAGIKV